MIKSVSLQNCASFTEKIQKKEILEVVVKGDQLIVTAQVLTQNRAFSGPIVFYLDTNMDY